DEFAEILGVRRRAWSDFRLAEAGGLRIGVAIEGGLSEAAIARPEAAAADLVRIRLAVGGVRDHRIAGRRRRWAAGEARHGEIEAAPKEMHRAGLAEKARPKRREHLI